MSGYLTNGYASHYWLVDKDRKKPVREVTTYKCLGTGLSKLTDYFNRDGDKSFTQHCALIGLCDDRQVTYELISEKLFKKERV
jgi:hypothetical protein